MTDTDGRAIPKASDVEMFITTQVALATTAR